MFRSVVRPAPFVSEQAGSVRRERDIDVGQDLNPAMVFQIPPP